MNKSYKTYNFIISSKKENKKFCSGSYFNIIETESNLEIVLLRDVSFSLIKSNNLEFELYLAKGLIFSNIDKINSNDFNDHLIGTFRESENSIYTDEFSNNLTFFTKEIDQGTFMSNPKIILSKNVIDRFIDNLLNNLA